ncbi:MAG TPA: type IV pilus assembly protein PilM [Candidatus Saccharimonadales bacterium]|nr:type IV pilus assembly protein PilM [Candidatus Saccharimonadales bacterium]
MTNKAFGLDIGATTIKAVSLGKNGSSFVLNSCLISPTPPKGMLSESPLDQKAMADAIRQVINDAQISSRIVNIALPDSQVYTKVIDMPILTDKELSSAIYWEAEQHIPVPLTDIHLVWQVLHRPEKAEEAQNMQVLLVGAPNQLISKYQHICALSGLTIDVMETEILSVVRALSAGVGMPATLIVDIGAVSTSLSIIRGGGIVFTYSFPAGGVTINRAIAADYGLSPQQAEEYKKVYGMGDKSLGGKIGKSTQPILSSILGEVKKAFAFYSQKYKDDMPIRQIILAGGTAKLPGIDLYFARESGIETVVANPWKMLSGQQIPKEILDEGPDYTIAVGLAMRAYE